MAVISTFVVTKNDDLAGFVVGAGKSE